MVDQATFVVQTRPEHYEVRQAPLPDVGADDALVALEGCGVCGTDVEVFEGALGDRYPIVPGHEPFGRILRIGSAARAKWNVDEGDRVAVHSTLTCGRCRTCRAGLRGCTAPEFASHLYLAPEAIVVPMSPDISVATASLFNVMSNGVDWVLDVGGFRAGMSIAILGPGPRGIASVIAASAAGAREIAVTGLAVDRDRLKLAQEMGANHALDVSGGGVVDEVLGAMSAPPDLVIDCTPMSLSSVTDAVRIAGRKGTVVLAGMKGPNGMAEIPVDMVSAKQLTLKGAVSRSLASMEYAISLLESSRWPFETFASDAYPIERAEDGLRALIGEDKPMHVRIVPEA